MAWRRQVNLISSNGDSLKVGATGKIGTLMKQDLDCGSSGSSKKPPQPPPRSRIRHLVTEPVSVHCNGIPWTAFKPRIRRGRHAPILGDNDSLLMDKLVSSERKSCRVEVVDVKCGSLLSSRLGKLGFSELDHSTH